MAPRRTRGERPPERIGVASKVPAAAGRSGAERFDQAYYDRYYRNPRTRVATPARTGALARFVMSYLDLLELRVESALDLGCGLGWWKTSLELEAPRASYRGVEWSTHLATKLGWEHGSVVDYAGRPADLVICQGVLQYVPPRALPTAIANLARLTKKALYLEALTREDWAEHVDTETSDGDVYLRPAATYRRLLARHFRSAGGGLYLPLEGGGVLFELERGR